MKLTSLLMAAIGMSFAGGSAYVAYDFMETQSLRSAAERAPEMVTIMVATQTIPFGASIEPHMATVRPWPVDALPEGAFTDPSLLLASDPNDARRARNPIYEGQPFLADHVSEFGEKVTIVNSLSPNGRAVAISVNVETTAGGFVTPGDYVDIVLTRRDGGDHRAVTILQNVRIIAVDQNANEQADTAQISRTVTVDVTPQEGQALAIAQNAGRLSLMLRNQAAEDDEPLQTLRLTDFLLEETPDLEEDTIPVRTITVRRGVGDVQTFSAPTPSTGG